MSERKRKGINERGRYALGLGLLAAIVAADQISKYFIVTTLRPGFRREVIPRILNFVLSHNTGGAFSILSGKPTFFLILTVIALGLLAYLYSRLKYKAAASIAVACVAAGACGNLIDRFRYGHVIDFVDLHWGTWHWYIFNVADVGISAGATILLASTIYDEIQTYRRRDRAAGDDAPRQNQPEPSE